MYLYISLSLLQLSPLVSLSFVSPQCAPNVDTKVSPERPEGPVALLGHTDVLPGLTGCQRVRLHEGMGHIGD